MRALLFLVDISVHFRGSSRHTYVEVVQKGETEGQFLEDLNAYRWETLEHVSRLGAFRRCAS